VWWLALLLVWVSPLMVSWDSRVGGSLPRGPSHDIWYDSPNAAVPRYAWRHILAVTRGI
jgi:hypothetical protein